MKYVYILESDQHPSRHYVGLTSDPETRLDAHNRGGSPHTAKFKPWKMVAAIQFADDRKAADFELYLKTGSGRAFLEKHFL
jgi:predicted GIY-YIG superfamily endonuclease